jgi:transcriptional regulator
MYLPEIFVETDRAMALRMMRENPLANVITQAPQEIMANPIPTLVDEVGGGLAIRFHLAIRNQQCESLQEGSPCLLLFTGPNCYVSPSWYTEHPNVPAWNYVCAHAYGTVEVMPEAGLEELLLDLSRIHEETVGGTWRYEELPDAFRRELLAEIRGFRLRVTRLEAKVKLSQNRTAEDRERVTRRLSDSSDPGARAVGRWMVDKFFGKSTGSRS